MKRFVLFSALLVASLVGLAPQAHADKVFYMRERWVGPTKTGTRAKSDSTWVFLKPCTGDNTQSFPVASSDTFYIDVSDGAWNDPEFTNYTKWPSDSLLSLMPVQMVRDSIPGVINIAWLNNAIDGTADSITFDISANILGAISNNKFPWGIGAGGSANNWQNIVSQPLTDASAITHKEWTLSVPSYPLYRWLGTGLGGVSPNTAVSRTCISRGVTLLRLIVGRRSTYDGSQTALKYAVRVGYPAVSGLGETTRLSGSSAEPAGVVYQRERWLGPIKTGVGNKDSSWTLVKPPNNLAFTAVSGSQLADTFYVDISDGAWNSPHFSKFVRFATDTTIAKKSVYAAQESLAVISLAMVTNVADADLDSISINVAAGAFGSVGMKGPWNAGFALGSNMLNTIHATSNALSIASGTAILRFCVPAALWYQTWFASPLYPNSAISRSVINRGITRLRVIAKCNSNDARTVANPKWALRVSYPAVTGLGETTRASGY